MTSEIERDREAVGVQPVVMFNQPLIFSSLEEIAAVENSALGDVALSQLADAGLIGLAYWNGGATQLASYDVIANLEDFDGRKILTTSSAGREVTQNLGASPVQMAFGEVYPALTAGLADTAEVPFDLAPRLQGAFTHLTEINYRPVVGVVIVNRDRWYELPEQARAVIADLARQAGERSTEFAMAGQEEARTALRAQDVALIALDPDERERIRNVSFEALGTQPEEIAGYLRDVFELIRVRSRGDGEHRSPQRKGSKEVEVLFATDRNDERKRFPNVSLEAKFWLGSQTNPGERYCGEAAFTLAADRPVASEDDKYFTLEHIILEPWSQDSGVCLELFADRLAAAATGSLLLFVHGFNNSFFDAGKRAAALKADMAFAGPVLIWSWPSTGNNVSDYRYDNESADFTRPHFRDLVLWLKGLTELQTLHVVSHSMGGRIVIDALEPLGLHGGTTGWPHFDNLVFAAPDVKTPIFSEQALRVSQLADRATLDASSTDWALWASEKFNQGPRAGRVGSRGVFVMTGLESVDASDLDDRWQPWLIKHSYVFDRAKGVADLGGLIVGGMSAAQRNLPKKEKGGLPYWLLGP